MPRTDLAIVFRYKVDNLVKFGDSLNEMETSMRGLRAPTEDQRHQMEQWASKRAATINAMNDCGLVLMLYYSRDRDEIFMRVAAEGGHLRQVAQMKKHKLELKPQYLAAYAEFQQDYAGRR